MENNKYTITLADGTVLNKLGINGDNFVSTQEVTPETFRGKLSHVVITAPEDDESGMAGEYNNMELVQIMHYTKQVHGVDDGWYFILREIPAEKFAIAKIRSDVAYLSMMSGIDLD